MFAPASLSVAMIAGFSFNQAAKCRGVLPSLSRASMFAPASLSAAMIAGFSLNPVARCSGVSPCLPCASRSAPAAASASMITGSAFSAAAWRRGVHPSSSCALGSAPAARRRATSSAVAVSKYSSEFQSAPSVARAAESGFRCVAIRSSISAATDRSRPSVRTFLRTFLGYRESSRHQYFRDQVCNRLGVDSAIGLVSRDD